MISYYQSRTLELNGVTISLIALATSSAIARLVARKLSAAKLWWDDLVIVMALLFLWGLSACYWVNIKYGGFGRHTTITGGPVGPDQLEIFLKLFLAVQVVYFASAISIKTSLILLYCRVFGVIRWFRWLLTAVWTVVVVNFVVCLFVAVFECNPVEFYWDKSIKNGSCINQNQLYRWSGVSNLLIDFVIWSLPLPVIWRLSLNPRQKFFLSAIFLLGLLACIASIVRVVAFNQTDFDDITYSIVTAAIWTIIEQSLGIICACLPTTRPLFGRLRHSIKHSSSRRTDPEQAASSGGIPLSQYASRPTVDVSTATTKDGFARLSEENTAGVGSVTDHAFKAESDDSPILVQGIVR